MAKARRKSTSIDEKTFGELSEAELNELNERMQRAIQKDIQDHPEHWARARAEAAELAKARKTLAQYMADPYGVRALVRQLKSEQVRKPRVKPQVKLAFQHLVERYPTERIPDEVSIKFLQAEIATRLGSKTKNPPGWDSVKEARLLHEKLHRR